MVLRLVCLICVGELEVGGRAFGSIKCRVVFFDFFFLLREVDVRAYFWIWVSFVVLRRSLGWGIIRFF